MSHSSEKLLITGTTGYIGFQTLTYALRQGYPVRAVVRAEKNIADLDSKDALILSSHTNGQLEFSIVPDFLEKDALVPVLKDITAVVHLASPLAYGIKGEDLEAEVIRPAIDMVMVVLEAALKVPTIKRVVITSSSVTLVPFEWNLSPDTERLYTSSDINSNPRGPYASAMEAYWASKGLSRQATRDFFTERSPHFDFVNLLPSVVIGADTRLSPARGSTISELLQGTRAAVMAPALTAQYNSPFPYVGVPVHVADVARAHIDAVDRNRISGNSEFILSSDTPDGVVWDPEVTRIAKQYFAEAVEDERLKLEGTLGHVGFKLDGMTTEEAFGWKFTSFEETMKGLIGQYLELEKGS